MTAPQERLSAAELMARLSEAEATLDAIRNGEVDAVVVGGPAGQQVYTLENADRPYRVLIEQMQEGAVTLSEEGTILYCNQRFSTLIGISRKSMLGRSVLHCFGPAERDGFAALLGGVTGGSGEFTLLAAGGGSVPVNISLVHLTVEDAVTPVICGVVTDLTSNQRRSHELAAANARLASEIEMRRRTEDSLQLALDAAGMGSWDLDLASGLSRRSLRHDQIFGHESLQPSWGLRSTIEHFVPEDRPAAAAAFRAAKTTGVVDFEGRICRSGDQATRWLHVKGRTYYEADRPVRILGVVTDVTDRRVVEEQLRQSQKMEAVGQLTGGIAHDFNNLLMVIGGSLDMLGSIPGQARTNRLLDAARQGVARGARLNQQLLAFSRRQDLHVEAVSVNALIPCFEHLLHRAVGEMVTIRVEPAPETWFCRTDPHQLETAILNLAINARDAMPAGGLLTIAIQNRSLSHRNAMRWGAVPGDYIFISVTDTGIGMAPEIRQRAFEPFFTTKETGKGTGLGLSQVYGFTKQSGGFVTIESQAGAGTTILLILPRTEPPTASPEAPVAATAESGGDRIILVVEDDPEVRAVTTAMLQDLGYRVTEAATAKDGLALMEAGEPIDLVLTDIIMPGGMNGIDYAGEVERRWPGLPVLLCSGYANQRFTSGRERPLLRKPYTQAALAHAVTGALDPGAANRKA